VLLCRARWRRSQGKESHGMVCSHLAPPDGAAPLCRAISLGAPMTSAVQGTRKAMRAGSWKEHTAPPTARPLHLCVSVRLPCTLPICASQEHLMQFKAHKASGVSPLPCRLCQNARQLDAAASERAASTFCRLPRFYLLIDKNILIWHFMYNIYI